MSDNILQEAAAKLLEILAQGAQLAGNATPEIIEIAGRYIQLRAVAYLILFAILWTFLIAATCILYKKINHIMKINESKADVIPLILGGGGLLICFGFVVLMSSFNMLPNLIPAAIDHRVALVGYILEKAK